MNGISTENLNLSISRGEKGKSDGDLHPVFANSDWRSAQPILHTMPLDELLQRLGTSDGGLTEKRHAELVEEYGENKFTPFARSGLSRICPCLFAPPPDLAHYIPKVILMMIYFYCLLFFFFTTNEFHYIFYTVCTGLARW